MLKHLSYVALPHHPAGGFDHADVHLKTGRVFVAHTANGTVEVIDGEKLHHITTLGNCPEASGVLCAQDEGLVFAAARASGRILMIDANSLAVASVFTVGSKPNGLAWDDRRKRLLIADVQDNNARLLDPYTEGIEPALKLPGRPRWCSYDHEGERFLVNINNPSGISVLKADTLVQSSFLPISVTGAHGLDLDRAGRAFVACDGKAIVTLDLKTGRELKVVPIAGSPDVIWCNPQYERLYCAIERPGVIEVVDTRSMTLSEQVGTEGGAHTLTFDRLRQRLYAFLPHRCGAAVYLEG